MPWSRSCAPAAIARALPALVTLIAGCDAVYGLRGRDEADAAPSTDGSTVDVPGSDIMPASCEHEDFDADYPAIQPRWTRYPGTAGAMVDVSGGTLRFSLPASASNVNYAGIIRNTPVDFTGGSATIQIIDPTTHPSGYELFLKLYDQTDNSLYYQANLAGSTMLFTRSFSNKQMSNSFPFDPSLHRWWRVSHRAGTTIVLQTSVDGVVYTDQLMFLANPIPLTQIRLEIGSGTYMPLAELAPVVDNFVFCPSV